MAATSGVNIVGSQFGRKMGEATCETASVRETRRVTMVRVLLCLIKSRFVTSEIRDSWFPTRSFTVVAMNLQQSSLSSIRTTMSSVHQYLHELQRLVPTDPDRASVVLRQLKLALLQDNTDPSVHAEALEWAMLLALKQEDFDSFGRHWQQLQPLYMTVQTERKMHMIGLNLMALLVDHRLAEFHSQLELLSAVEASSPWIQFPIGLERKLMVGIYDEVLDAPIPDPTYQIFMEQLLQTVRESIADCMEVTYKTLSVKSAAELMKFGSVQELTDYMAMERDDWMVDDKGIITFQPPSTDAMDVPSMQWIQQSLTYATELERIV